MTTIIGHYTGDLTDVLHGIFEEHQVHNCVSIVIVIQGLGKLSGHGLRGWETIVECLIERGHEVCKDQWLWIDILVELAEVSTRECFLCQVRGKHSVSLQVLRADETITVNSLTLVRPEHHHVIWLLDGLLTSLKHTLHHVGQVTHIELIVEVDGCLLEGSFHF